MKFAKQLTPTTAKKYKAYLIESQNSMCRLCGHPLGDDFSKIHLDHCHDTGHIRGALHSSCNRIEGKLKSVYRRMGGDQNIYFDWIRSLAAYLEQDSSQNPLHPQHVTDQVSKFKALNKSEQENRLTELGVAFDTKATKTDLTKLFQKYMKSFTK